MNKSTDREEMLGAANLGEAFARIFEARSTGAATLDLSGLGLTELPAPIGLMTRLQSLNLSKNQISVLPSSIGQLIQLMDLNISNNLLTMLPESIGRLTQLQRLDINENKLIALTDTISELSQLQHLSFYGNQLTAIPDSIGQLTLLQNLDIARNPLTIWPRFIDQLVQLQVLDLSGIQLKILPDSIGQLTQLRVLDLSNNQLTELPDAIRRLEKLERLSLAINRLRALPESVSALKQLKSLFLSRNEFEILPKCIVNLPTINVLSIGGNPITRLPDWLYRLQKLECFDISCNTSVVVDWSPNSWSIYETAEKHGKLTTLPEALKKLESLTQLYLHRNEKLNLPKEIVGATWSDVLTHHSKPTKPSDILEYYFRVRGGRRPLNEAKLILVGRGAVGKTSIVNRLIHNRFDPNENKTEGINITEWKIQLNGKEDARLNIWDFGGQEIMHATHQFFLTQRSLYLLVLNGREGGQDADAEYWLRLIASFGAESPVIVVLNKIKAHPFDLNHRGLQQKYPNIRDFIKTDCSDGTGVAELRKAIEAETDRLEHLRDAFPAAWFSIKDQLVEIKKNYLTFDQYREVCQELGEYEQIAQEALAGYLHNLGIVLNFKDDPRLQDTHVLNPHWVTNGIYKILNSTKLEKQQGEIRLHDLAEILAAEDYPVTMRRFIFDLMKKFELCFSFPDDDAHYLIPELLDKQEPVETARFNPEASLNFQYHYPVLPEGLLPRFVVRTHVLSEGMARWRTGVILAFEGCRALVKADVQDKKIFISVSGPALARRRLLAVIRSDFERIHRDIRNLQPQEMVPLPDFPNAVVPYEKLLAMERAGINTFPEFADGKVIEVNVSEMLNGVDLEGTRRRERIVEEQRDMVRLFYSYSHKDETLRNELETHLKLLQRQGLIDTWHDRKIEAGEEWKRKIDENLERADIILLLVSADFIASDYCYEIEMKRALERHEKGEARVIPVILRDCKWNSTPFAKLQALPKDGKAVKKWPDKDTA